MSLLAGATSLFVRNGALTTCATECCGVVEPPPPGPYRQAISCVTGNPVNAWRSQSLLNLPTPKFFWKQGLGCAVFLTSSPSSMTPGTILAGESDVSSCAASLCGSQPACCNEFPKITGWILTITGASFCGCAGSNFEHVSGALPNGTHFLGVQNAQSAAFCDFTKRGPTLVFRRCQIPFDELTYVLTLRASVSAVVVVSNGFSIGYSISAADLAALCRGETISGTFGGFDAGACGQNNGQPIAGPYNFSLTRAN
jgi:hypothetical protein